MYGNVAIKKNVAEGRKEDEREGDAGSVADLARRRTNSGAPSSTTGYAAQNMTKKNVQTAVLKNTTRT